MDERIVKNNRVSRCRYCDRDITTEYKVRLKYDKMDKTSRYYHLTCHYRQVLRRIKSYKEELSEFYKSKRKLKKYHRYMILENLGGI